jgi:hypothetical protein
MILSPAQHAIDPAPRERVQLARERRTVVS